MPTKSPKLSPLLVAGTLVLIVAALYWARAVLMPVTLAMLLTFLLSPCDRALQRLGLGPVFSVALLAVLTFSLIGVIGWGISAEVKGFSNDLPRYQENIKKRAEDMQVGKGTALDQIRATFGGLIGDVNTTAPFREQVPQPVPVTVQRGRFSSGVWPMVLPLLESVFRILLVVMLVIFMLLERDELRNRVIRLLGYGRLSLATEALQEAGTRVSRYLFAQFIVNACLGVAIGLGLFLLGVPYALLWGFLIVVLRFIPYIGIWIPAILAFGVSLAASSNWWQPLSVLALFAVLESVVGMVVEPVLFSQTAGTSKLSMLVAIAFWTWLWGPVGLVLATPLTACLAVVAKNVPQLEFIAVLLGDAPVMQVSVAYYKHLLAMSQDGAEAIVEEQLRTHAVEHVFDDVLVPALHYAKRDCQLGLVTDDERDFVYQSTRQIVERIGLPSTNTLSSADAAASAAGEKIPGNAATVRILAWPAHDEGDAIALLMLQQLLDPTAYEMAISAPAKRVSEIQREVEDKTCDLFCVGFIPPGGLSASRYLSKVLHGRLPELNIVVGYWGLPERIQDDRETLLAAGATHVAVTLIEARDQIVQAMHPHVKSQPALPPENPMRP